jgi:hypothetical protein
MTSADRGGAWCVWLSSIQMLPVDSRSRCGSRKMVISKSSSVTREPGRDRSTNGSAGVPGLKPRAGRLARRAARLDPLARCGRKVVRRFVSRGPCIRNPRPRRR